MKKIISIILVIVIAVTVSMPVFALSDTSVHTNKVSFSEAKQFGANALVEYGVDETFLVIIPQINFNEGRLLSNGNINVESYVEVINPVIKTGRKLVITVAATSAIKSGKSVWELTVPTNAATIPVAYTVELAEVGTGETTGVLTNGSTVLSMQPLDNRLEFKNGAYRYRQILECNTLGSHQSGAYEDNLTFSLSIK